MSLINCPSCGKQMSDKAIQCPHCGYRRESCNDLAGQQEESEFEEYSGSKKNIVWYVVCALIVLCVAGYFAYDKFYLEPIRVAEEKARLEAEYQERQRLEAEQKAKEQLERFKKFQTKDLACFMLHGRVKTMTELYKWDAKTIYNFSEDGSLISGKTFTNNKEESKIRVKNKGGMLVLHYDFGFDDYNIYGEGKLILDDNMRLVKSTYTDSDFDETDEYFDYNHQGWPLKARVKSLDLGEGYTYTTQTYKYSDIDEYGNWTSNGSCTRIIDYYPVEDF